MKMDRLYVLLLCLLHLGIVNSLPTNLSPGRRYGHGFPLKWRYDPQYVYSEFRTRSRHGPRDGWLFDRHALVVDALVGVGLIVASLIANEVMQTARGNRQRQGR
jgi:hypothetical protein